MSVEKRHKIELPEIILMGGLFLLIDLAQILLLFLVLDDFFILDAVSLPILYSYMYFRGLLGALLTGVSLLELIPYVGALPFLTITFALAVFLDRNPTLLKLASLVPGSKNLAAKGTGKTVTAKVGKGMEQLETRVEKASQTIARLRESRQMSRILSAMYLIRGARGERRTIRTVPTETTEHRPEEVRVEERRTRREPAGQEIENPPKAGDLISSDFLDKTDIERITEGSNRGVVPDIDIPVSGPIPPRDGVIDLRRVQYKNKPKKEDVKDTEKTAA